jgi:hypothetical protein
MSGRRMVGERAGEGEDGLAIPKRGFEMRNVAGFAKTSEAAPLPRW